MRLNRMITDEKKNDAIDDLILNAGDKGLFVDDFMKLLCIGQSEAEQLMIELHAQSKLELKWVKGKYFER